MADHPCKSTVKEKTALWARSRVRALQRFKVRPGRRPIERRSSDSRGSHDCFETGIPHTTYDVSPDGRKLVVSADSQGKHKLWLVSLDRQIGPHEIPNVQGTEPSMDQVARFSFVVSMGIPRMPIASTRMGQGCARYSISPSPFLGAFLRTGSGWWPSFRDPRDPHWARFLSPRLASAHHCRSGRGPE